MELGVIGSCRRDAEINCRQFFLSAEYIERIFGAIGVKRTTSALNRKRFPTSELLRQNGGDAKDQNCERSKASREDPDQRVEK